MAETKRVSDQYTINAPAVIIDGNLTVMGTTTTVSSSNAEIEDNTIVLNSGETGAGVTLGTSGFEIDRGSLPNVGMRWNESVGSWELSNDGTTYGEIQTSISTAGGVNGSIQFNTGGAIDGDSNLLYNGVDIIIGNVEINTFGIGSFASNNDLEIYANGSGTIYLRSVIKMENELADPSSVSGNNLLYAKTPDVGNTGLFFVNTTKSDELISKSKAVFFGLIL